MNRVENRIESNLPLQNYHFPMVLQEKVNQFIKRCLSSGFNVEMQLISFSNRNFKIQDSLGRLWVLRIPNEVSYRLCDQKQEKVLLDWAYREGFSLLNMHGYDEEEGYLLTPFLLGSSCTAADFQNASHLKEALAILHRLHTTKMSPITAEFDPFKRYAVTAEKARQDGICFPQEVESIVQHLKSCLSQIPKEHFQKVPCHNDPNPENFFRQDARLYLHDWELATCNDPMWDLALLSEFAEVDSEEILRLYPTSDPLANEKIVLFRAFIFLNTLVWAALESQKPSSSIPLDRVETMYHVFLAKIQEYTKSELFETSLKKMEEKEMAI